MAFKVWRSTQTDEDLGLILDHLVQSYLDLGDELADAFERAIQRITAIEGDMKSLGTAPFQGTLLPNGLPGIRRVTKHQAIFYLNVDEPKEMVRILAVFFGGQGHQRHMLKRLAARPPDA